MKILSRALLLFLSIGVAGYAAKFFDFKIQGLLNDKGDLLDSPLYLAFFYTHIGLGALALVVGPFQFFPKWRARNLQLHRNVGKFYVVACLLSGLSGLVIAFFASGWIGNKIGFAGLAIAWLITTTRAYLTVRQGDIERHKLWMIRSFAMTFAAVTLRLYLPLLFLAGLDFTEAYQIVSWACWVPNLLIVEWWIRNQRDLDVKERVGV